MAPPSMKAPIEAQLRPITFDEYRALPDDGPRYELIYGELFMMPSPKAIHQFVIGELFAVLRTHAKQARLGVALFAPDDARLSGCSAVQPDIFFFSAARKQSLGPDFAGGAPDLVVEVLSPSNRRLDLIVKRTLYAASGIPEYWIVDPDKRTISVNVREGAHYADTVFAQGPLVSLIFPGIVIDFETTFDVPEWLTSPAINDEDEPPT